MKTTENAVIATRAEKKDATKGLIREILGDKQYKHNDLIEEVAQSYTKRFGGEDTENVNDVKGRVGSVLDIMKKDGDILYEGGMYALKQKETPAVAESVEPEKPTKTKKRATKKDAPKAEEEKTTETVEKTAKKTTRKAKTKQESSETGETEGKELPKKRGRKPKQTAEIKPKEAVAEETTETEKEPTVAATKTKEVKEVPTVVEVKAETTKEPAMVEVKAETEKKEAPVSATNERLAQPKKDEVVVRNKNEIIDMSFLLRGVNLKKKTVQEPTAKPIVKPTETLASKPTETPKETVAASVAPQKETAEAETDVRETRKTAEKDGRAQKVKNPVEQPKETSAKRPERSEENGSAARRKGGKPMTEDEKLREKFLSRLRALGGEYFEYYSVYLLKRYAQKNGRRVEGFCVCAGDGDGGIDGEIELTDKLGFRESIYIQSKNWDPGRGDEKFWVVGETLLQQFMGACVYRRYRDRRQHVRGIFITTSRFTPEAKRILEEVSDSMIGYDGAMLYETAKECCFGLVQKNGVWRLDEKLLSGMDAFFNME